MPPGTAGADRDALVRNDLIDSTLDPVSFDLDPVSFDPLTPFHSTGLIADFALAFPRNSAVRVAAGEQVGEEPVVVVGPTNTCKRTV
jgi:hypothetical protein